MGAKKQVERDNESSDDEMNSQASSDSGDSSCEEDAAENLPPQRLAWVVMTFVIGGYTLIGPLQHDLKHALNIADTGRVSEVFTQSVAFVQWGKTFSTIGQNVLLSCVSPLYRVYIAMSLMFCGVLIPPLFVFTLGSHWIGWVPLCYGMVGLALGVFECTYLSVISPLGPLTKSWAIMGFPTAFAVVNIFGQTLMALFDMPVSMIFWYIVVTQPMAIFLFKHFAPHDTKVDGKSYKQSSLMGSLADWRSWLIKMIPFCLVNVMSHFVMESVLPACFNAYNAPEVSFYGPANTSFLMKRTWFFVIFSFANAIGDMSARKIGYCFDFKSTAANYGGLAFALSFSTIGLYLATQGIAIVALLAVFMAFFGAGFNYAVTAKYIDRFVPRKHNLAAYSVWMFVGYMGAIAGAVLVTVVRGWVCGGVVSEYQCLGA